MEISIIFLTHELLFCTKEADCSDVVQLLHHVFLSKFYKVEDHIFMLNINNFMLNLLVLLFILYIFYMYENFKPEIIQIISCIVYSLYLYILCVPNNPLNYQHMFGI